MRKAKVAPKTPLRNAEVAPKVAEVALEECRKVP